MEVCYVCKEPAKYYDDWNQYNNKLVKCGVVGCDKIMHPTNKCSTHCKSGCGSSLCHKHKEKFSFVKGGCWKSCTVCTRICLDCKERFSWDHRGDSDILLSVPAPERCEECTSVKEGICAGCFEYPIQEGRYCETCAKIAKLNKN